MNNLELRRVGTSEAENLYFERPNGHDYGFGSLSAWNGLFWRFDKSIDLGGRMFCLPSGGKILKILELRRVGTSEAENLYFARSSGHGFGFGGLSAWNGLF